MMKKFENIIIDPQQRVPFYRQISNSIIRLIDQGILNNGDTLHPERKLSEELGVSRGTVRKAYGILQKEGLIVARRGGGYYVSGADKVVGMYSRKVRVIFSEIIQTLMQDGQLPDDIFSSFKYSLLEAMKCNAKIKVGVVECRREIKYVFERFFSDYSDIYFTFYVLDDLYSSGLLVSQLEDCDLILTTASHYYDLCVKYPELAEKAMEIVMLWTADTITQINLIPPNSRIGCIYNNSRTIWLVKSAMKYFGIEGKEFDVINENNVRMMEEFVRSHDVIIAEPESEYFIKADYEIFRRQLELNGGMNIMFEHYIDTSSAQKIFRRITNAKWNKRIPYNISERDMKWKERESRQSV